MTVAFAAALSNLSDVSPHFVETFLGALADRVVMLDRDGRVAEMSDAATPVTLQPAALTLLRPGVNYLDLCRCAEAAGFVAAGTAAAAVTAVLRRTRPDVRLELESPMYPRLLELQASPLHAGSGAVVVHRDITDAAARLTELRKLAYSDALTGLTNRTYFFQEAERRLALAQRVGHAAAFLYLDLDGFKKVNDTYGHAVGDTVLKIVSARLQGLVRAGDLLARLGGDEFAFFLQPANGNGVGGLVGRIHQVLGQPVVLDGAEVRLGVSVGVASTVATEAVNTLGAVKTTDVKDVATLLERADRAMYAVKQQAQSLTYPA